MRTVVAPWVQPLTALADEHDLRIVTPSELTEQDASAAEFYVPEFSMRTEPLELMAALPSLAVVQALTAGVEQYLDWLPLGVTLCAAKDLHATSVAEHAVALALAQLRDVPGFVADATRGRWNRRPVRGLADSRVTILGAGAIGLALADRLAPFECQVGIVARTAREGILAIADIDDVLARTEVLFVCLPASASTDGLLDARRLALLPDDALIVNVGRGSTVDTIALEHELSTGRLRAALDVVDREPLSVDDRLWTSGALITPHVAGNSAAFHPRAVRTVVDQLQRWVTGMPLRHVVVEGRRS